MWEITLSLLVFLLGLWIVWRKRRLSVLKQLGIPGPEPSFWFGNLREISTRTPLVCHREWQKKYGDIYGYYFGIAPIVMIADADILKQIQVSDFHKFINRPGVFSLSRPFSKPGDGFTTGITRLKDKRWKELRSTMTPSFTTSKLKMMAPIINDAIDSLIQNINDKAQKGKWFDIYGMYQGLTMDVIGRTAFGIQTDCQRNPNDPFLRSSRVFLSREITSFFQSILFCFPELQYVSAEMSILYLTLKNRGVDPVKEMVRSVKRVINTRRENAQNARPDLLQHMIDAKIQVSDMSNASAQELTAVGDNQEDVSNTKESNGAVEKEKMKSRGMTDDEIIDNALLFFLAGYETTSTALAFTTHFLLHYPEVQERVRNEVKSLVDREGKLDYVSVQKLQYLDQVFTESLRMYPPVYLFVNRKIKEDVTIGGYNLKKGMTIQVPVFNIQRHEKYWEEPDRFNPDRFSPENKIRNHPFAFQAFGAGPRNCVGMRFAQMEAKLALARILLKYRLEKCEKTDKLDITLTSGAAIIRPRNGINLKAVSL